jgi:transcription antitermination factor NusG
MAGAEAAPIQMADPLPWFAVMVRPGHEKFASRALSNRGYEEFMPMYRERRRWSDRIKEVELALFPGYLFCRFDPQYRLPILTAPGVFGIISFSGIPHPIEDAEVSRVKALVGNGKNPQPYPYLKAGQRVLIGSGPLSGVEGILIHIKNEYRLVASVTLLQRSVSVEVDADSVTPIR